MKPRHLLGSVTALLFATPLAAQSDLAAGVKVGFTDVSDWVARSAALIPADKYTYKPTASVRTVGQQIAHIADSYAYYCSRAAGRKVEWSDAIEKGATDKTTLATKLKQATQDPSLRSG